MYLLLWNLGFLKTPFWLGYVKIELQVHIWNIQKILKSRNHFFSCFVAIGNVGHRVYYWKETWHLLSKYEIIRIFFIRLRGLVGSSPKGFLTNREYAFCLVRNSEFCSFLSNTEPTSKHLCHVVRLRGPLSYLPCWY